MRLLMLQTRLLMLQQVRHLQMRLPTLQQYRQLLRMPQQLMHLQMRLPTRLLKPLQSLILHWLLLQPLLQQRLLQQN
jgi:hypothetical protein